MINEEKFHLSGWEEIALITGTVQSQQGHMALIMLTTALSRAGQPSHPNGTTVLNWPSSLWPNETGL